ncbi:MAG: DUF1570 domain-containing protein [Pirellula sp.]
MKPDHSSLRSILLGVAVSIGVLSSTPALHPMASADEPRPKHIEISFDDPEREVLRGELVTENPKYGLLVQSPDGQLIAIPTNTAIAKIVSLDEPMKPLDAPEISAKTLGLLPAGAKSITTEHFVICYDTSDTYARWNAGLYEKMYKGMVRFWKEKGLELQAPRFPLVALIFKDKNDYVAYSKRDFQGGENTFGYYTQTTNRLATFDLTGIEGVLPAGAKVQREELLAEIFSRPEAERQIATILHEACHQIAFNTGLQTRLGDYPLWVSEGIATFFESADTRSSSGWAGTGRINAYNLQQLRNYFRNRPSDSLTNLLIQDERFRQADTATAAYGESWGLTFYLIKKKPKEFVGYMRKLKERPPGNASDPKQRLADFQASFGQDLEKLDKEFARMMASLRP